MRQGTNFSTYNSCYKLEIFIQLNITGCTFKLTFSNNYKDPLNIKKHEYKIYKNIVDVYTLCKFAEIVNIF